jgi:hypothetical protein
MRSSLRERRRRRLSPERVPGRTFRRASKDELGGDADEGISGLGLPYQSLQEFTMKITLDIEDGLLIQAKALYRKSLTALIEEDLQLRVRVDKGPHARLPRVDLSRQGMGSRRGSIPPRLVQC